MGRIAVIVTDDFEDSEYIDPVDAFEKAGHTTVNIGIEKGQIVKGKKKQTPVRIDMAAAEASVNDFDALLIPGGYSPDKLRAFDAAVAFAGDFTASGKPVFVICHGPQLLITAGALQGRRLTGYKSISVDIRNAGAHFTDEEVVVDGNLVSSRHPGDLPAFIRESMQKLG